MSEENGYYIFRKSFRHPKTGKLMLASNYGRKAWKIWIPIKSI